MRKIVIHLFWKEDSLKASLQTAPFAPERHKTHRVILKGKVFVWIRSRSVAL